MVKFNKYLFLIYFISIIPSFGQEKCFTIYDSINSTAISYANIWKNDKIYSNSDINGRFCIKDTDINNEFKITCIGYITKPINLNSNSIHLEKENVNLSEVVILNAKRKHNIELGKTSGTNVYLTATFDLTISEIGKIFKPEEENQLFLKEVKFKTLAYQNDRIVALKIYSLNENDEPDNLLTTESIVLNVSKYTNITSYKFENKIMPLPTNGFLISIQFILIEENKQYGTSGNLKDWFFYDPSIGAKNGDLDSFYFNKINEETWKKIPNSDLNIKVYLTD